MTCRWAGVTRRAAVEVGDALNESSEQLYGDDLGVVLVHYCQHCNCTHVGVINAEGVIDERVVTALETALQQVKEGPKSNGKRSQKTVIETTAIDLPVNVRPERRRRGAKAN